MYIICGAGPPPLWIGPFALLLTYIRFTLLLRVSRSFGGMIAVVIATVNKIALFLGLVLIFVAAFSHAMYVLLRSNLLAPEPDPFANYAISFATVFFLLTGSFYSHPSLSCVSCTHAYISISRNVG